MDVFPASFLLFVGGESNYEGKGRNLKTNTSHCAESSSRRSGMSPRNEHLTQGEIVKVYDICDFTATLLFPFSVNNDGFVFICHRTFRKI
jgi:hypothetical protein